MADRESRVERRLAVIDLGSNSFRLVVFTAVPGRWWRRTDEIFETVRIGEGQSSTGRLGREPMRRALRTLELYAHFCRASGIEPEDVRAVATSAIRCAENREDFLVRAKERTGLPIEVLSKAEEARYGYLGAVNSTTLEDGVVLDLGGGSLQLVEVDGRHERAYGSWPLGTVRMTERFLPGRSTSKKERAALRAHALKKLGEARWLSGAGGRLVGVGGTVRNLAEAAQRAAGLPVQGVQGAVLGRAALDELVAELASRPAAKRGHIPGIKPGRGEIILAGAIVVQAVLEAGEFDHVEVTEAGMREGVFFAAHLAPADPPLVPSVRDASVRNLAAQYETDFRHAEHVAALSLQMWQALVSAGVVADDPQERELLSAAALLHDIGMAVDYDDHHKHTRYLILGAGLPGFSPREVALIAQIARYHRKGSPGLDDLAPLGENGDEALVERGAALLRLAEELERSHDQVVREARLSPNGREVTLELISEGDPSVARWGAERQGDLFARAFGRTLRVV